MDRLEKAESVAANAEASRNAQVEAVVDQLLAFKQAQTAELAQRDSQVAALQTLVLDLQQQVQCFCISPLIHGELQRPLLALPNLGGKLAELMSGVAEAHASGHCNVISTVASAVRLPPT